MYDNICHYPLGSDLFAQAIHPTEPLVSVGLASGHVETFRLPFLSSSDDDDDDDDDSQGQKSQRGLGMVDRIWRTRRHKGSCRCLGFGAGEGRTVFSAGTDGWLKIANTETGIVESKIAVPRLAERYVSHGGEGELYDLPFRFRILTCLFLYSILCSNAQGSDLDAPTVAHALSPQTLLLATDSGALHLFDPRVKSTDITARPQQTHYPHDDYVSSLSEIPPSESSTSGFSKQWLTTGGTNIALTDLRRGVLVRSEDQEEELLSSTYITGLPAGGSSQGEKLAVGSSSGVLTLFEKGAWDDQDERIVLSRHQQGGEESIDVLTSVPDGLGADKMIAAGQSDGHIAFVRLGSNKVVQTLQHDELEGVLGLGFDVEGRMVSGGGKIVKVWQQNDSLIGDVDDDEDSDNEKDSDGEGDDSEDDGRSKQDQPRRKRRKSGKKGSDGGKQVMAFEDLD